MRHALYLAAPLFFVSQPLNFQISDRTDGAISHETCEGLDGGIGADYLGHRHSRLQEDQKAPATINREIQILGRAFRLGVERREILPGPHIRRLAENNVRQGFFTRAEFEAVVAALPEYLQDFTRFAFLCAWRKGQTAALKWEHVNRTDGVIIAPGEIVKNKHPHKIVLEGELTMIIERRVAGSAIRSRERAGFLRSTSFTMTEN